MNRPVIIAGAGPTGLMLAAELRVFGVEAVVLERRPEPIPWSRALVLQRRSVEVFQQRGLHWFDDAPRWYSHNFGFVNLTRLNDREEYVPFRVAQRRVERLLEERCAETGVDLRYGHEVVAVAQDDDGVTVGVRGPDGAYELRGAYLAGCDGGRSTVRKLAGVDFPGTASTCHGVTADVDSVGAEHPDGIKPQLTDKGLFAVTPLDDSDLFRATFIEFGVPLPDESVPVTVDELRDGIRRVTGLELELGEVHWLSRFGNATRLAAEYRSGRVFLAGDAAHIHFPSGGQGLNTGIQDAVNLGWKLAADLHGWAPAGLLDTYHAERHEVGRAVCMYAQSQVALYHPLDRVGPLRSIVSELLSLEDVARYLLGLVTGVGLRYPLPGADAHPLIGQRVPSVELVTPSGSVSTNETLHDGRGVLLELTDGAADLGDLSGWADRVAVVRGKPAPDLAASVALVRPDGYIAYAHDGAAAPEALHAALRTWFGEPDAA